MNIDPKLTDVGYWKQIDGKKLPATKLQAKTIQTKGNAGTSEINLSKFPFTDLLFEFSTGCFTQLKKMSFTQGDKKMILNLIDIPSETIILLDSIPFVEGELTYNIAQIVHKNKECEYENLPGNKFYLHYLIPYKLIKNDSLPKRTVSFELKNDTLFNYADSLKTKLISKGKVKIHKTTVTYYHNAWEMKMNENLKRKEKHKITTYLKRGTWTYYFDNYSLQREEKEKMERKIERKIYSKRK